MSELTREQEKTIKALEAKLAIARGEADATGNKQLIAWYDKQVGLQWAASVPRSAYCAIAARQLSQLNDQAATYGLPIEAGSTVDLHKVLRWFHSFLSEWGPKISKRQVISAAGTLEERKKELEIKQLEARIASIEADVARKQGESVPMAEVEKVLRWLSGELRKVGERMGKRFGREVQVLFNEQLERIENELRVE